jgi:hypothetical protein
MRESHSDPSVHALARKDPEPIAADPAFVAKLQQAVNLANQTCDRATALAHKLAGQLREALTRVHQLELDSGLGDRLQAEAETAAAKLQSDADARVDRTKREADERIARMEAEAENRVGRLQSELAQAKQRANQAKVEADALIELIKIEAHERVARAEAEANERLSRVQHEVESHFRRLNADLAQIELRADRAEQWLVLIRREIEEHLMPSLVANHERLTAPGAD